MISDEDREIISRIVEVEVRSRQAQATRDVFANLVELLDDGLSAEEAIRKLVKLAGGDL